jgi:hypothetical protein
MPQAAAIRTGSDPSELEDLEKLYKIFYLIFIFGAFT